MRAFTVSAAHRQLGVEKPLAARWRQAAPIGRDITVNGRQPGG